MRLEFHLQFSGPFTPFTPSFAVTVLRLIHAALLHVDSDINCRLSPLSAPSLSLPVHVAESVVLVLVKIRQVLTDSVAASVQGIMSRTDCVAFASEE